MNIVDLNRSIESMAILLGLTGAEEATPEAKIPANVVFPESTCLLIKGDNLKVLSSLLSTQADKIDFCYIDPPYNTGQEFIYSDNRVKTSKSVWGKHHEWLAFMMPRLIASHLLLKPEGLMAISIDDYECAYLKILMDQVFGSENFIATLVVCRSKNGRGSKQHVAVNHEYVLLYGKSKKVALGGLLEGSAKVYERMDEHGAFTIDGLFRKKGDASLREDRPSMHYPLYYAPDGKVFTEKHDPDLSEVWPLDSKGVPRRWLWGLEKARAESWKLFASKNGVIYVKNYKSVDKRAKLRSLLNHPDYLTDKATCEIKAVYGEKIFETPKPVALIRDLIDCCTPVDGIVLDFFAGTGTTAVATWELNRQFQSKRKVILVENDQAIKKNHIAQRFGYSFTSDLTEYRLSSLQKFDPMFSFSVLPISNDELILTLRSKAMSHPLKEKVTSPVL